MLIEPQAPQTEMNHPEPPCRAGQSPPQTWLHDWHCACLGEWSQDTPQLVLVAWVLKTLGVEVGQLRGPTLPSHILPSTLGRDPNKPLCFPQGQNLLRTPSAGPGASGPGKVQGFLEFPGPQLAARLWGEATGQSWALVWLYSTCSQADPPPSSLSDL